MRFLLLGAVLGLVWFLAIDGAGSLLALGLARFCARAWPDRPAARARLFLTLRLAPAALAALFVVAAFAPIFWRLEPHDTREAVSPILLAGSMVALLLLAAAVRRGCGVVRAARRQTRGWMRGATPLPPGLKPALDESDLPVWMVEERFPVIALAGIVAPALFVARQVLDSLTSAELEAVVAHEEGHQRSRDNLKRLALAWAPGVLAMTGAGAALEREWARAAELAADCAAGAGAPGRPLDLASALVKVARLAPVPARARALASTLHDGGDIATRVERLAALADQPPGATRRGRSAAAVIAAAVAIAAAAMVCAPHFPSAVQALSEFLVRLVG